MFSLYYICHLKQNNNTFVLDYMCQIDRYCLQIAIFVFKI